MGEWVCDIWDGELGMGKGDAPGMARGTRAASAADSTAFAADSTVFAAFLGRACASATAASSSGGGGGGGGRGCSRLPPCSASVTVAPVASVTVAAEDVAVDAQR